MCFYFLQRPIPELQIIVYQHVIFYKFDIFTSCYSPVIITIPCTIIQLLGPVLFIKLSNLEIPILICIPNDNESCDIVVWYLGNNIAPIILTDCKKMVRTRAIHNTISIGIFQQVKYFWHLTCDHGKIE